MIGLLLVLWLHHVGDVAMQPSWLIQKKHERTFAHYEHAFVWAGVVSLGLYVIGDFELWKFVWLLTTHFTIDIIKYRYIPHKENYNWIYLDQALHYLTVIAAWAL